MGRLSRYLLRLFAADTLVLLAVAAILLFLYRTLRLFDGIAAKGEGLLTLIGQSALGMPEILPVFTSVCIGAGLGRTLRSLQSTGELQIIHSSRLSGTLARAVFNYALLATLVVLLISHVVEPICSRLSNEWSARITADFVGRSLVPHKFVDVADGVTLVIGSRDRNGTIGDFFADDRRSPETRRTYIAKTAEILQDDKGYVLQLRNGVVQYMTAEKELSTISFDRYDLAVDRLTGETEVKDTAALSTSFSLISSWLNTGEWPSGAVKELAQRSYEGLRVLAICLFTAAIAAFPSGARRRFRFPIELTVLAASVVERVVTSNTPLRGLISEATGSLVLLLIGAVILVARLRGLRPVRSQRATA